jgi:kynurenine formamidase
VRIIDLSLPIRQGMQVHPGDPAVRLRQVQDLAETGWRLHELCLGSHTGSHVNAPWHMAEHGQRLEDLPLEAFVGQARVRGPKARPCPEYGLIYAGRGIDSDELALILAGRPPFVGVGQGFPLDVEIERGMCQAGLVSFENLVNTELLPGDQPFLFAGLPLPMEGDGSPVRAVAIL